MTRSRVDWSRRRFLQNGLAAAGLGLLSGCGSLRFIHQLPLPSFVPGRTRDVTLN
jgi:hypothetical protein